jgi:hypothetical protein
MSARSPLSRHVSVAFPGDERLNRDRAPLVDLPLLSLGDMLHRSYRAGA